MERRQALRQARDRKLSVCMDKTKCVCGQWWRSVQMAGEGPGSRASSSIGSFMRGRWRVMEKAQVGRKRCLYSAVPFKFQMISATCALETHSAFLPEVAGPQPSPALREPW